jgi:uncharacterized OsmC-like protein
MSNAEIRTALDALGRTFAAQPDKAMARYAPATARIEGGLKCRVAGPSGETIETDMPRAMGGSGSGPNPGWFFRASIASCCATVIAMRAAQLGIDLTDLEVTVEGEGDQRGLLGLDDRVGAGHAALRTNVRIGAANATPDRLRELVEWAEAHSPVGCTVRDAPANVLTVTTP